MAEQGSDAELDITIDQDDLNPVTQLNTSDVLSLAKDYIKTLEVIARISKQREANLRLTQEAINLLHNCEGRLAAYEKILSLSGQNKFLTMYKYLEALSAIQPVGEISAENLSPIIDLSQVGVVSLVEIYIESLNKQRQAHQDPLIVALYQGQGEVLDMLKPPMI